MKRKLSIVLLLVLAIPFMATCATGKRANTNEADSGLIRELRKSTHLTDNPALVIDSEDPEYLQAKEFADLLNGNLDKGHSKALVRKCKRNPNSHLYCFSISRINVLNARKKIKKSTQVATKIRSQKVVTPQLSESGKVKNWRTLRRANITHLLKGLDSNDRPLMDQLVKKALKETKCPNRILVALAATLEEGFPDKADPNQIADLYARASRCHRKGTSHKEHFLTRAGLLYFLAGNYTRSEHVLRQVKPTDAYVGRAWYWLYRAQKKLGKISSEKTFKRLIRKHPLSFHSLYAVLEAGQDPKKVFLRETVEIRKKSKRSRQTNQIIKEIEGLQSFGFMKESHFLVTWASDRSRRLEPEVRLYLAQLGSAYFKVTRLPSLFIRKPKYASIETMNIAYPTPFSKIFENKNQGTETLLLYSVARKESKFDPDAKSHANAQGLMQINPKTAAKLTNNMSLDLYDPNVNVTIGGFYLGQLITRMNGVLHWAIAAYNAGENAADSWIARFGAFEPLLGMDLITYRETRTYVGMVLNNLYWYRTLHAPERSNPLEYMLQKNMVISADTSRPSSE